MKQSFALIASMIVCSALVVALAWAPFNYTMSADKLVKNILIGAALGLVFYFLALHKKTKRTKAVSGLAQGRPAKKKARSVHA
jgi:hypothetical protein